jgi:glycosyltransferase involved in cell wall biosynthesis
MRLLLLTRYEDLSAASRLRFYQYVPHLQANGIEITHAPLLTNADLKRLYSDGRRGAASTLMGYLKRAASLFGKYDVLWIEKELFPMLPALGEKWTRTPYVVDYDDAVFHNYDMHRNGMVRRTLGSKIDNVMLHSAVVVAGNSYLADRARKAGAKRVEIIPTVIDIERYTVAGSPPPPFTVGWIGSPSTSKYLHSIEPALKDVCAGGRGRLLTVGAKDANMNGVPIENRAWAEDREVSDIQAMHTGVMPLPDEAWERGKCGYKLIQYMACRLPVVASPVGVNAEIVEGCGFVADTLDEWRHALLTLRDDAALRTELGAAGRRKVEEKYTLQVTAPRMVEILKQVANV